LLPVLVIRLVDQSGDAPFGVAVHGQTAFGHPPGVIHARGDACLIPPGDLPREQPFEGLQKTSVAVVALRARFVEPLICCLVVPLERGESAGVGGQQRPDDVTGHHTGSGRWWA
jgi:hypothetical protein